MLLACEKGLIQDPVEINEVFGDGVYDYVKNPYCLVVKDKKNHKTLGAFSYKYDHRKKVINIKDLLFGLEVDQESRYAALSYFVDTILMYYEDCQCVEHIVDERNLKNQLVMKKVGFIAKPFESGNYISNGTYRLSYAGNC